MGSEQKLVLLSFGFQDCQQFTQCSRVQKSVGLIDRDHLRMPGSKNDVEHCDDVANSGSHSSERRREIVTALFFRKRQALDLIGAATNRWRLNPLHARKYAIDPTAENLMSVRVVRLKMIYAIRKRGSLAVQRRGAHAGAFRTGLSLGAESVDPVPELMVVARDGC